MAAGWQQKLSAVASSIFRGVTWKLSMFFIIEVDHEIVILTVTVKESISFFL